ncbi:hypothetical protein GCM10011411_20820 [Aurantiacibacter arachoides]|nr:hypothetical protein GCM10011411_20820 [Aurantiacibacter arachoides]
MIPRSLFLLTPLSSLAALLTLAACGDEAPPAPPADAQASEQRALAQAAELLDERPDTAVDAGPTAGSAAGADGDQ